MTLPKPNSYPTKIYVSGEVYKIQFVKGMHDLGETDSEKRTIKIKYGMSPRETLYTLVHELIHAMEFEHGIPIKHKDVHRWEKAVSELIIDNFLSM